MILYPPTCAGGLQTVSSNQDRLVSVSWWFGDVGTLLPAILLILHWKNLRHRTMGAKHLSNQQQIKPQLFRDKSPPTGCLLSNPIELFSWKWTPSQHMCLSFEYSFPYEINFSWLQEWKNNNLRNFYSNSHWSEKRCQYPSWFTLDQTIQVFLVFNTPQH